MFASDLVGVLFALSSALVWGSADFSGGVASRRNDSYQVLVLTGLAGLVVLILCAGLKGEPFPSLHGFLWSTLGGIAGALGLGAFYRALSMGYTASVAPTAAVIGAGLPVGFAILTEGLPDTPRLVGFVLAFLGIWFVSRTASEEKGISRQAFGLACLAGVFFGAFFIFIAQVERSLVFTPLVVSRGLEVLTAMLVLRTRKIRLPLLVYNPVALLGGVLDAGGAALYMLARQYTRLDVAALLSSLYPATTVLLAYIVFKEKIRRDQWIGVFLCLAAVGLISI
jgi:drug/metabolite transporter (DMT)-like permease